MTGQMAKPPLGLPHYKLHRPENQSPRCIHTHAPRPHHPQPQQNWKRNPNFRL